VQDDERGNPFSFAVFRRHSRNTHSLSITEELAIGMETRCCPERAGCGGREAVLIRFFWALHFQPVWRAAQASQLPQFPIWGFAEVHANVALAAAV